jgi:hypothetical protein
LCQGLPVKRDWQQVGSVLELFGKRKSDARKAYLQFVKKGVLQGRRPELTGGGLLRSIGGWAALSALRGEAVRRGEKIARENQYQLIEE